MKLINIVPECMLKESDKTNEMHFLLLHWAKQSKKYREFFRRSKKYKILDQSMYELGKPLSSEELIEYAKYMKVNEVIAPDRFYEAEWTVSKTLEFVENYKYKNLKVMGVIQAKSEAEFRWVLGKYNESEIDVIGLSRRGYKFPLSNSSRSRRLLANNYDYNKPIHLLGINSFEDLLFDCVNPIRGIDGKLIAKLAYGGKIDLKTKFTSTQKKSFKFIDSYIRDDLL